MPQRDDQAARSSCPEPAPRLDLPAKSSLPPSDTLSALIERALREEAAVGEPILHSALERPVPRREP